MSTSSSAAAPVPKRAKTPDFRPAKKAIALQHIELQINTTLTERYGLVYLPPSDPFSTACWHYEKGGIGEPARHIITFGANLANNMRPGCDLGDYAKAYHRHEAAHSLWTERDLPALDAKCKAAGLPFELMNVFEDARIEHKWRQEIGERFEWNHFEEIKPVDGKAPLADRAASAFMAMIQCEGDPELLAEAAKDVPEAKDIREQFYDRAVTAKSASDLIPLMKDFVGKYGMPKNLEQSPGGARATAGDMKTGLAVAGDPTKRRQLLQAEAKATSQESGKPSVGDKVTLAGRAKGGVLMEAPDGEIDPRLVSRLVGILQGAFRAGDQRYKRETPSKRILVRDFALERSKIYRAVEKSSPVRTRIAVVFDCSGSMWGPPNHSGRHLVLALAEMARGNQLDGDLILSLVTRARARQQVIPLRDVTEDIAKRIGSYGDAEGLANAMECNTSKLVESHCTLVYTDGNICDNEIDRSNWHRRGVFTLGCYVGTPDACPNLGKWFDAPLCRASIENLALAIGETARQRSSITRRPERAATTAVARTLECSTDEPAETAAQRPAIAP